MNYNENGDKNNKSRYITSYNADRFANRRSKPAIKWKKYYVIIILLVLLAGGFETSQFIGDKKRDTIAESQWNSQYTFRNETLLQEHYQKHGVEMGFSNAEEYLAAANKVVANSSALHKKEKEDGDDVYYIEASNEFVIISTDGYIRTYFLPRDGMAYYDRQ